MKATQRDLWRAVWIANDGLQSDKWFSDFYDAVDFFTTLTRGKKTTGRLEYEHNGKLRKILEVK